MVNAVVEATKKAFYVGGKYAEMVSEIGVNGSCLNGWFHLEICILIY